MFAALALGVGLVFGSVPFGLLIGWYFFKIDLRRHGSGNIGAANAMRVLGRRGAVAVLVLDALKGYLAVALFLAWLRHQGQSFETAYPLELLTALGAVVGHCFTPWLSFRGGKGIATSLGAVLALSLSAALAGLLTYVLVTRLTRISAIGSITAIAVGAIGLGISLGTPGLVYGVFSLVLVIYTHRDNLARLREGRELQLRVAEVPRGE